MPGFQEYNAVEPPALTGPAACLLIVKKTTRRQKRRCPMSPPGAGFRTQVWSSTVAVGAFFATLFMPPLQPDSES